MSKYFYGKEEHAKVSRDMAKLDNLRDFGGRKIYHIEKRGRKEQMGGTWGFRIQYVDKLDRERVFDEESGTYADGDYKVLAEGFVPEEFVYDQGVDRPVLDITASNS